MENAKGPRMGQRGIWRQWVIVEQGFDISGIDLLRPQSIDLVQLF